jgi:YggT family protein
MGAAAISTLLSIVLTVIDLYIYVILAAVIMSWLIGFNVVNVRNEFVRQVVRILAALTEPVFRPLRRVVPAFGGLDFSPLIVFIVLYAIEYFIALAFPFPEYIIRPFL